MKKLLLIALLHVAGIASVVAQQTFTIKGIVKDVRGITLPGADIVVAGTKNGASTNFDGEFELSSTTPSGEIVVSYVGYITEKITFSKANANNLEITLKESTFGLDEVLIVASAAIDRKTPVAVSTIKKEEIQEKLGNQELPELLKSTPGVYTSRDGGAFGDSEILVRGFQSRDVAVLINGIPINDMENGRVFWSNWAGLGSVTASEQVQRGLGAAKIAVPSIGGTINVVTETTDVEKGGVLKLGLGNDGYTKYGLKLSSGLMDNGFAVTAYTDRTFGDGYVDGTPFDSFSYFANISKIINDAHKITFTAFGTKQTHGQRRTLSLLDDYINSPREQRYNPDWGIKNGDEYSIRENFFHKPQLSLNHYWQINDRSKLTNVLYFSVGKGGGTAPDGPRGVELASESGKLFANIGGEFENYRIGNFGPVDIDRIINENIENGDDGSTAINATSINNHTWLGSLSTFNSDLTDNLNLTAGLDLRYYRGEHWREVNDLLGGKFVQDNSNVNNPNNKAKVGDKIFFHNDGIVYWTGGLTQLEYDNDWLSAFVTLNGANTSYQRVDFFQKTPEEGQKTKRVNFLSYGAKGGANFRLDDSHNAFFNVGYFERAPFFRDVFQNFDNDQLNEDAKNQKIFSAELGYGLRTQKLAANVNIYRTEWKDQTFVQSAGTNQEGARNFANIPGVNSLHQGVEFDFEYRPFEKFTLTGMLSIGDWKYTSNIQNLQIFDQARQPVGNPINVFTDGVSVGRAAQTTSALGAKYKLSPKTSVRIDYNYYDRYFADFDPLSRTVPGRPDTYQVPDYGLFDFNVSHGFNLGGFDAKLILNVYNFFDEIYINRAGTTSGPLGNTNNNFNVNNTGVFLGPGRTFSLSSIINF